MLNCDSPSESTERGSVDFFPVIQVYQSITVNCFAISRSVRFGSAMASRCLTCAGGVMIVVRPTTLPRRRSSEAMVRISESHCADGS